MHQRTITDNVIQQDSVQNHDHHTDTAERVGRKTGKEGSSSELGLFPVYCRFMGVGDVSRSDCQQTDKRGPPRRWIHLLPVNGQWYKGRCQGSHNIRLRFPGGTFKIKLTVVKTMVAACCNT